jgi:DNA-binding NtrC family response regulator
MKSILVVDDDPQMRSALGQAVQRTGCQAIVAENGKDALRKLKSDPISMMITDMKMPGMDGLTLIQEAKQWKSNLPVLVITGYATVENAVETMKHGVTDYLMKPFSFDDLEASIHTVLEQGAANTEIIFESAKMKHVIGLASSVADSDTTILIYGESGTGKELLARHIHCTSSRKDKPFVAVNCAAIPDNLLESELFGFVKGAFTGASGDRTGKFELAKGGTILLDEIGEMPLALQAKLLRVLQEKEIDKVGGRFPLPVDARVIATTNRDLYEESLEKRFREDLYYRLSVFPLQIPPLRERPEDIRVLSEVFLTRYASKLGKDIKGFSGEAFAALSSRQWRGNVRELENVIHRAVLLAGGDYIGRDGISQEEQPDSSCGMNEPGSIRDMERNLILQTLDDVNGNKTQAAKKLGLSVRTIRNKLNSYGKDFPSG